MTKIKFMGKSRYVCNVTVQMNVIIDARTQAEAKEKVLLSGEHIFFTDKEVTSIEVTNTEVLVAKQNVFKKEGK